jgi:MoaA/NifB/PqqE/SkfB family radical SAM enzyme
MNDRLPDGPGLTRPRTPPEREAFIERQLGAGRAALERFPAYVNIETINTCNARCIMCGIDFDKKPPMRMSDALFSRIVGELSDWRSHIRKVNLYFDCEPLLDRTLHHKIRALKDAGIRTVTIATNGSALTPTRSRELLDAGLDEVYVSIDSLDAPTYEKIRVGLSFRKVYDNTVGFVRLRDAVKGSTRVRVQMIWQSENDSERDAFVSHWRSILSPGDVVVVHRAHNWGGVVRTLALDGDTGINDLPCTALWSNAMIHVDGSVALCSVDTVQGSPHALGDAHVSSLAEIWRGVALRRMRERHLDGRRAGHALCDGCTVWRERTNETFVEI